MDYGVLFCVDTDNIGDDVQTYAAYRLLPKVSYFIDREQLPFFVSKDRTPIRVLMNAWFMHRKYNFFPSEYIDPICISMHFSKYDYYELQFEMLDGPFRDWLEAFSPIGCRDSASVEECEKRGIPAFFSGCLTLTLPKQLIQSDSYRKYVCAIDVNSAVLDRIRAELGDTDIDLQVLTQRVDPNEMRSLAPKERMERVENRLSTIQNARCVVTTRLHCALPCLAMDVPVLLINDQCNDPRRFGDYLPMLHHCSSNELIGGSVDFSVVDPPANPKDYLAIREKLIRAVNERLSSPEIRTVSDLLSSTQIESAYQYRGELIESALDNAYIRIPYLLNHLNESLEERDALAKRVALVEDKSGNLESCVLEKQTEIQSLRNALEHVRKDYEDLREWQMGLIQYVDRCQSAVKASSREIKEAERKLRSIRRSRSYLIGRAFRNAKKVVRSKKITNILLFPAACVLSAFGRKKLMRRIVPKGDISDKVFTSLGRASSSLLSAISVDRDPDFAKHRESLFLSELRKMIKDYHSRGNLVVCVMAPIFTKDNIRDGYFRRIKAVDDLLGDNTLRIYMSWDGADYRTKRIGVNFIDDNHVKLSYCRNEPRHNWVIRELAAEAGIAYHHSVGYSNGWITRSSSVTCVYDIHGALPEEHCMRGDFISAQIDDSNESMAAQYGDAIVSVTERMAKHFKDKYPESSAQLIVMPILDDGILSMERSREEISPILNDRPVVVYAGGMQEWQMIPKMQDAIEARGDWCSFRVFTKEPGVFWKMWGTRKRPRDLRVESLSLRELHEEYASCQFGFVLREDNVVNNVACPTKLVEYLLQGIVPILDTTDVGDFVRDGMRYISIEDFLSGKLPDEDERIKMALSNFEVIDRIIEKYELGKRQLIDLLRGSYAGGKATR